MKQYKSNMKKISLKTEPSDFKSAKITSSKDAADVIRQFFSDDIEIFESAFILLLNQSNNTIGYVKISQGGITGTVIDPILVAKYAVEALAKSVILCHNHPSGNLTPSNADKMLTEKVVQALKYFDCRVPDHIILTKDEYFSFADNGLI